MRGLHLALLPVALLIACAALINEAHAVDDECMKGLSDDVGRARRTAGVYVEELKTVKNNPWSANAMSVCNSAVHRAEQYYDRQTDDKALCNAGSDYVDGQVVHLYKNAVITCRSSFEDVLKTVPSKDQRRMTKHVDDLLSNSK